jgi:hypothetical protein
MHQNHTVAVDKNELTLLGVFFVVDGQEQVDEFVGGLCWSN